jgi:hypothetical protein
MFKNKYYSQNKNIIKIPKHIEGPSAKRLNEIHDVKNEIKPNVNRNNTYENIRNKIENNESEKISTTDQKL